VGLREWMERTTFPKPTMKINPYVKDIFAFKEEDFELVGYNHHPKIVFDVAY
jgi:thymidylate synthase